MTCAHQCSLKKIFCVFLVYVQSDIVNSIHGVLLIEISEPAGANSRSEHRNLEENPFSFQCLCIQTDEITSKCARKWRDQKTDDKKQMTDRTITCFSSTA